MKTNVYHSYKIVATVIAFALSIIFKNTHATDGELAPDQNPNYKRSMDKYMAMKEEYNNKQNTTIQKNYKAIDDVQAKKDKKVLKKERRHERKMARIVSRNNRRTYYYSPYYGRSYGYNNYYYPHSNRYRYYNNGYGCNSNYNRGYSYWNPYQYGCSSSHNNVYYSYRNPARTATSAALLGLGMYLLLR